MCVVDVESSSPNQSRCQADMEARGESEGFLVVSEPSLCSWEVGVEPCARARARARAGVQEAPPPCPGPSAGALLLP